MTLKPSVLVAYGLLLVLLLFAPLAKAEFQVKVYAEKTNEGYALYADNLEFAPVSIQLEFSMLNLSLSRDQEQVYVIGSQAERVLLTTLTILDKRKAHRYSFQYLVNWGDHTNTNYDKDYGYDLPYQKGGKFKLIQGYHGSFSHHGENALDFRMPEGTEIVAVRDGIVVQVQDQNNEGCPEDRCKGFNNFILIYQEDGTFANYSHLLQNGSTVKVGDKVSQGEVIGRSGNTGFSSEPHLHLVIFTQQMNHRITRETKFKVGNGSDSQILSEAHEYLKAYGEGGGSDFLPQ